MTHFPQSNPQKRAARIPLGRSFSALILLDDGKRTKGKLQSVSVTGGLLNLPKPLGQGDFVEIAFQMKAGSVRGMAEMLDPMRGTAEGTLQPFRFVALGDDDHRVLSMEVDSQADNFLRRKPVQWSPWKSL